MTEIIELDGNIRKDFGTPSAKRLRKNDRLPAVVYGENGAENIYLDLDLKKFEKEYLKGGIETRIINVTIENESSLKLLCYQIDLDPVSDRPRHLDFISVENKKEVRVKVPLRFVNFEKSPGIKRGGYLNVMVRKLQVICSIGAIPSSIEIDCGSLRLRQSVKISDLKLPDGVRAASKKDLMLVRIIGRGRDDMEDAANTAAAGTTAATTTTATAAAVATNTPAAKK